MRRVNESPQGRRPQDTSYYARASLAAPSHLNSGQVSTKSGPAVECTSLRLSFCTGGGAEGRKA